MHTTACNQKLKKLKITNLGCIKIVLNIVSSPSQYDASIKDIKVISRVVLYPLGGANIDDFDWLKT